MNRDDVLTVRHLNSYYERAHILFDLDLGIRQGEVVVPLGRNGAGKSTTLKSIMGLVDRATGDIEFNGIRISGKPAYAIARLGLGYVPEDRRIFTDLSVLENLEVGRRPPREGIQPWTHERIFEIFPNLSEIAGRLAGQISGGEQQMLAIARTLMGNPIAVLLDEPSEGLAPVIVDQMGKMIQNLKLQGLTVLLSEQNINFALRVSDRAYVIEKGHIRYEATAKELSRDDQVRHRYLAV